MRSGAVRYKVLVMAVHIMLVKFGVPKNQNVYQYDYHVKNLIIVIIASPLCTE